MARASQPYIEQIFIARRAGHVAGRAGAQAVRRPQARRSRRSRRRIFRDKSFFYIPSLSSRTIVYKGLLLAPQIAEFYKELTDPDAESALCLVHQRFSTNTFPTWQLAHPYRYLCHNGEINTVRGNVNWMNARENVLASDSFGDDLKKIFPVIRSGRQRFGIAR